MVEDHSRAGVPHHFLDSNAMGFRITGVFALSAGRSFCFMGASFQPLGGKSEKFAAFWTERFLPMMVPTKQGNHVLNGFYFEGGAV